MKKTKIICSIGPASLDFDVMSKMVMAGMNVARINFTHATLEERLKAIDSVNRVRSELGSNIAILWDTKGPEFRSGLLENKSIELIEGNTIKVVKEKIVGNSQAISVNHPEALDRLNIGELLLLENDKMRLQVIEKTDEYLNCKIIAGGILGERKSISAPGVKLDIPYISDLDREDIEFACLHGGEYLAISFVSCKEDVLEIKELLKKYNREDLQIICKIESDLGITNLKEILEVSDGVMVARGDLGTEVSYTKLPIIQKRMIKTCREMGKLCIVATEMLETMMENSRPKRAETSDIANAVLDGTDAVMLSGETTVGKHPIETVAAMAKICEETERYAEFDYINEKSEVNSIPEAIAENVVESSNRLGAKLICAATITGTTAKLISNFKPKAPILALCPNDEICYRLALNWGVYAKTIPMFSSTDAVLNASVEEGLKFMSLEKNDRIVLTGGFPTTGEASTNLMKIEEIK